MVSWTAQLPTNQRQTKGLLLRSLKPRMEREAELLNVIQALQGQVEVLQNDHLKAKRMPKKAALAPVELSSSDEGGTVAMDDVDSDPGAFDNSVNLEDGNIHFGQNRRGSLDSAKFTAEQMQQFINELAATDTS
jgi:hypothetical protein